MNVFFPLKPPAVAMVPQSSARQRHRNSNGPRSVAMARLQQLFTGKNTLEAPGAIIKHIEKKQKHAHPPRII